MEVNPEMLANSYLCLQREVFVNFANHFFENVQSKNKNIYQRAVDFSKDFNKCEDFSFENLELNEKTYYVFCNYVFDFINYVRKLDSNLFDDSVKYTQEILSFPTFPTLHMSIQACGKSLPIFLDARESGTLDEYKASFGDDDEQEFDTNDN